MDRQRRLEAARIRMRRYRQRVREEQRHHILERERLRQRERRAAMDDQQREAHLQQERNRQLNRRQDMEGEELDHYLQRRRLMANDIRMNMNDEQRAQYLEQQRNLDQRRRDNMSQDQQGQYLEQQRNTSQQRRDAMNGEQRAQYLEQQRNNSQQRRDAMNDEERAQYLKQQRNNNQQRRDGMNDRERAQYLEQQRNNDQIRRNNMNEQDRAQYLQDARFRYQDRVRNLNNNKIENLRADQRLRQRQRRHSEPIDQNQIEPVEPYHIGEMDNVCTYCGALRFRNEPLNCCHNGKVDLPPLQSYPEELKVLFDGQYQHSSAFRRNIRNYNCAFSFASFGVKLSVPQGRGPYCFRIQGQTYHRTTNLHPNEDRPQYGQLYIIDANEALQHRMQAPQNRECSPDVMTVIDEAMKHCNPYVNVYKYMHTREQEEEERARRENQPIRRCMLHFKRGSDIRRYNFPTSNEIAAVFISDDGAPPVNRDIVVYPTDSPPQQIPYTSCHLDPMSYPLLFPHGEFGWHTELQHTEERRTRVRNRLTMQEFYSYRLAFRGGFSIIHKAGKLFQQYLVDAYVKVEGCRLQFLRNNQAQLRVEQYRGLMDYLNNRAENENVEPGVPVILPSSFTGSPRNMHQYFQDAMAIVSKYGKPDFFLTYTCNPKCPEIQNNLQQNETAENRPDLVARVYKAHLAELLKDTKERHVLGIPVAHVHVIEFQKRGLPHCHMLIILRNEDKIRNGNDIDRIVSAEIPDETEDPVLHNLVKKFMIHGPCGAMNPTSPCMEDGKCSKNFPKKFNEVNSLNVNGYPEYRRRNNGVTAQVGHYTVDNRNVVAYNAYLLKKYQAHINLEICSSVKSIKYIFKYVYKGHDCASIEVRNSMVEQDQGQVAHDEIKNYLACRYVSPPEAMWRLSEYKMHDTSHAIYRLAVHLQDQQRVYFQRGQAQQAAGLQNGRDTTLTAWFKLNESDEDARAYLYPEIPMHYVFNERTRQWTPRRRNQNIISRMYTVSPRDPEKFHLRILLLHVRGAKSFEDMRTVENAVLPTFKEACEQLGLLEDDEQLEHTLSEALTFRMPAQLRVLFAILCVHSAPVNALNLWNTFKEHMLEDFLHQGVDIEQAQNMALYSINEVLVENGTNCVRMGLPEPVGNQQLPPVVDAHQVNIDTFTEEQRQVSDAVIDAVERRRRGEVLEHSCFYVDAPGGCGKTYMFNALMNHLQRNNYKFCSGAWTGIASTLLKNGRTIHSLFKLPVPLTETCVCNVPATSEHADLLRSTDLIVLDEASMIPSYALHAINNCLQDICGCNSIFGGKVILLGGDFRQVLPILPRSTAEATIEICLKNCSLWPHFQQFTLTQNIRAAEDQRDFAEWLLNVGNGTTEQIPGSEFTQDDIEIPLQCCVHDSLVKDLYSNTTEDERRNRVILSPKNSDCLLLNEEVLRNLQGEERVYYSTDRVITDEPQESQRYPLEFLNSLTPSGMPPHQLRLKVGCIIMLLRNISIQNGLCNGTRLEVVAMHQNSIEASLLSGDLAGRRALIPRLKLAPSDPNLPFTLERNQFPVRLAYAMTINKSQGQTFGKVGLFLPEPVFSHGQLYVALSRAGRISDVRVQVENTDKQGRKRGRIYTKNLVCREVLI